MRVVHITLAGVKYPMCMSLSSVKRIEEEFGSLEKMMAALSDIETCGITPMIEAIETALGIFLDAGRIYCGINGETVPPLPDCPLSDLIGADDADLVESILEVVGTSSKREVEAAPPKKEAAAAEAPEEGAPGSALPPPKQD